MKIKFLLLVVIFANYCGAVIKYVDKTIGTDSVDAYVPATRATTGGTAKAYSDGPVACIHLNSQDTLQIRGGVYQQGFWQLPYSANGTSGSRTTIMSYPGEWAILDGNNAEGVMGIGRECASSYDCEFKYWVFKNFEVRNYGSIGMYLTGGYILIENIYCHDNALLLDGGSNPDGFRSYRLRNSKIWKSCFHHNGGFGDHNRCNLLIWAYPIAGTTTPDTAHAAREDTICYNLFDSAECNYRVKTRNNLCDGTGTDLRFKALGNVLHHNLFTNSTSTIMLGQDFAQFRNNIVCGGYVFSAEYTSVFPDVKNVSIYNNTIINGSIVYALDRDAPPANWTPYGFICNNIVDSGIGNGHSTGIISVGAVVVGITSASLTNMPTDKNLIYRPQSDDHYAFGYSGTCMGMQTTSEFNTCYTTTNYNPATENLFVSTTLPSRLRTINDYVASGTDTIKKCGIGGNHPFLGGVTIPTYIGATPSNDSAWVSDLYALKSFFENVDTNDYASPEIDTGSTALPVAIGRVRR